MRKILTTKYFRVTMALFLILGIFHFSFLWYVNHLIYDQTVSFADVNPSDTKKFLQENTKKVNEIIQNHPQIKPFIEIDAFDDDAKSWSNIFSQYSTGALVFDANNDGKLDVYFCQDGQNWTRPTDDNGVLGEEPRYQSNVLYINQGNDQNGLPQFAQLKHLAKTNNSYVKEELIVENYLFPRQTTSDSEKREARKSAVAIAVDINSDGRLDLLVGNIHESMLWSHEKTQRVLTQIVRPIGRQAKASKLPLSAQGSYFINYTPRHNIDDTCSSGRGEEHHGANSLFLNMGDKDNDGLPEWKDISREAGIEGQRSTLSFSVADIDLDGDLDIFEANIMDPDYWPGGSQHWAGSANQIYINQLAQTGKCVFVEKSQSMNVDGLYDSDNPMPSYYKLYRIPFLPIEYSIALGKSVPYKMQYLNINGKEAEHGQISWASVFQDVNSDGYPDIWVANDLGFLRLYMNKEGKSFEETKHLRSKQTGMWMTFSPGDFNNDLKEDLFAGNMGSGVLNLSIAIPDPREMFEPIISTNLIYQQIFYGHHDTTHALIDGSNYHLSLNNEVTHSKILPPDTSHLNNVRALNWGSKNNPPFIRDSLDAYEFAWGSTSFDLQNDGKLDLYYVGCLYGRGGGIFSVTGSGPGRLLVNLPSDKKGLHFVDLTAEHHAFNISELQYDKLNSHGYIYRKSPLQNWPKRDMVYSYDRSSWSVQGPEIQQKVANYDMIQLSENGRVAISSDLNGDGFLDLLIRNIGGYDSRSSQSVNLKFKVGNKEKVLPAHDYNYPTCTNFEPGTSRVFINKYSDNYWIKIALTDSSKTFNRHGIGAKVIINNKHLRVKRAGQGNFASNRFEDLHFGLGKMPATKIKIIWPDKKQTTQTLSLSSLKNGTLTISKTKGIIDWRKK
ncbi:CRTAC1 family protein [Candidatus Uabimicrobium sp. HlEnr_7]|uniref:CRTAC1 family protein n=1 Tax=Candidatus Uabimicrobium helgolandensis TaxID=3095367 RepID=UPI0035568458